ncbi:MAG: hypothetical protein JF616_01055 [Fibrobacteres bacterium]|nr:hypothetical protein [Fibrobacterota bacterium]
MRAHQNLIALAILSLSAFSAVPAAASTTYSTSRLQITFPDGWQPLLPFGPQDSLMSFINLDISASSWIILHTTDHPMTAQELDAYGKSLSGADPTITVSNGSQTLGGKSFIYLEYDEVDTTTGAKQRTRLYYTYNGSLQINGTLTYDPSVGTTAQADMESALASLTVAGTPILAFGARTHASLPPADHDILGRSRAFSARTRLFRLPAR